MENECLVCMEQCLSMDSSFQVSVFCIGDKYQLIGDSSMACRWSVGDIGGR